MSNSRTPLLVATALIVAVILIVRPGQTGESRDQAAQVGDALASEDPVLVEREPSLEEASAVDPRAGAVSQRGEALRADVIHLYDVSTSVHTGLADNPFERAVNNLRPAIDALREDDLLLPQRHRVGTIGAVSLMQAALCDVRLEAAGIFVRSDTAQTMSRLGACERVLRAQKPESLTDIHGALHYASLSLKGSEPKVRGIVLVTDLAEYTPKGRVLATPDLSGICIAVYSVVTPEAVTHPDSLAAREARWRQRLESWNAKKVMMHSMLGFSGGDFHSFFRACRPRRTG
jgi:hypothetical protein